MGPDAQRLAPRHDPWPQFLLAERSSVRRYTVAVGLAAASLVAVQLLQLLEKSHFSSLALTSVVLSAVYGGRGPALLDTAITTLGIDLLFTEPRFMVFDNWVGVVDTVVYVFVGLLIAEIVARLRDAYRAGVAKQAELLEANRSREQVLAIVSHDLRSPLSVVLMGAASLGKALPEGQRQAVERIERAARQMSRLVEDLLDAVRIEKGQFRVAPALHDVVPILHDAIEDARAAAQAKAMQLSLDVPPGKHLANWDKERISQVLANLLGNAIKFSPQGGPVTLALRPHEDGGFAISVSDCGPGIPEAQLPRLFERHWQARETAHHGTGLGLFITRGIVDAHGGRIDVRSRPGGGSVFTVYLPGVGGPSAKA
jgi:signal transduction histidine kinase